MELQFDPKTGMWGAREEPFATIEVMTGEEFDRLTSMVEYCEKVAKEDFEKWFVERKVD